MNQSSAVITEKRLKKPPMRLHHHGYTTDNHEENRQFYEETLGIPLVAMYVERVFLNGEWVELGHAFYELGDGSALAFFNFADAQKQAEWKAKEQSLFVHISFLVEEATQEEIEERLSTAGIKSFQIDHGFCKSIYVKDPNGLMLEFTVDHKDAIEIHDEMAATAQSDLQRWMEGSRTTNNRWRSDASLTDAT
jgi:catechol 2,3-dioxygenase-like lactoylglutathione lyase family enzyme